MSSVLQIGPFAWPLSLLVLLGAALCAAAVGHRLGRAAGVSVEPLLWRSAVVALIAARLVHVFEFRGAYLATPLDILDLRDGGWNAAAGLTAIWLYAISRPSMDAARNKVLRWALAAGSVLWLAGGIALSLQTTVERRLPPLALMTLDGRGVRLDTFAGRPTVINLWATWCGPCVREMPMLNQAQRELAQVNFVFVNQGEPAARVGAWLQARGLALDNVLIDGKGAAGSMFDQRALPTTLFFDAQGRWVATRIGELSRASLAAQLHAATR